ncbi:hypothetical protein EGM97_23960 [Pseudomonas sp. AF32]|nr:hypothetical protein [Pseudomonas sp. AF32]
MGFWCRRRPLREQARSHRRSPADTYFVSDTDQNVGAGLLAKRPVDNKKARRQSLIRGLSLYQLPRLRPGAHAFAPVAAPAWTGTAPSGAPRSRPLPGWR